MLSESSRFSLRLAERFLRFGRWAQVPLYPLFVAALYTAFLYAPRERVMGEVQRIFYFHVGAAWCAMYVGFALVFLSGIVYLKTRKRVFDHVGASAAEIGFALTTINLLTGMLWAADPLGWNTWWPWGDPRVTSVLVLWLIYLAYLIFRSSIPEGEKKYKYAAVFGIVGFLNVPIVTVSIRIWRTIHPVVITMTEMRLEGRMIVALFTAVVAFTFLFVVLFCLRFSQRLQAAAADEIAALAPGD